jgi:hypothetical protein
MSDPIISLVAVAWHRPITLKGNVWGITPPPFNANAKGAGITPTPTPAVPRDE